LDGLFPGEKPFRTIKFSNQRPEVNFAGAHRNFGPLVEEKEGAGDIIKAMIAYSLGMVTILSFGG
jgi:hypothetical protein